ncbi:hypothetical protein MA9V2_033 [Chryseobacterium phage MA9V-2]|nr:hypothetical protein MA9V2_033 [Chryseobacterium phage MA9V-2]
MRSNKTHPLRQVKTENRVVTYAQDGETIIKPSKWNEGLHGVIVQGNVYAVTDDGSKGGLIGDNFTTDEAEVATGQVAMTMDDMLNAIQPNAASLAKALYIRLTRDLKIQPGSGYESSLEDSFKILAKMDNNIKVNYSADL